MDRESSDLRSAMSQTRAEVERKLALLSARARGLTPRGLAERYLPAFDPDRALGAVLTLIGLAMAWSFWRGNPSRRGRVGEAPPSDDR
jgi:hypothetical protein